VADLLQQTVANGLREVLGQIEYNCIVR
jgi:hypothetical protein